MAKTFPDRSAFLEAGALRHLVRGSEDVGHLPVRHAPDLCLARAVGQKKLDMMSQCAIAYHTIPYYVTHYNII